MSTTAPSHTVATFASAREFLDSPALSRAACLVLDVSLQGMSGFDLQERLAADHPSLPIIFITALDEAATRERFRRSGVVGAAAQAVRRPHVAPCDPTCLGPRSNRRAG
jgi:FixJ family two-component response regulator